MSKHTKTAAVGIVAAGALVLSGCSIGGSTEAKGEGTVKSKVTRHVSYQSSLDLFAPKTPVKLYNCKGD